MTLPLVGAAELRAALVESGDFALLDLRQEGGFGHGHLLAAVNLPLSHLELRLRRLVPWPETRLVLCDGGAGLIDAAAVKLRAAGYDNLGHFAGGPDDWRADGFEIYSGVNVVSKAFGEVVEHRFATRSITAEDLHARQRAGEDLVILDSRPREEFHEMCIPGGIDTPGAELVYRARDLAPDPATLVVVNCAGRTRSIIGAQSLVNAGLPNPVVALRNGTMGWHLAGLQLECGAERHCGDASIAARDWARAAAARVAQRFGVRRVDIARLEAWRGEAGNLYVFDVRTPEEYHAGHLPGARSAPGGQLVQATDQYLAVRGGRVVLVDDNEARATMTASWLLQMGLPEVFVLAGGLDTVDRAGDRPRESGAGRTIPPEVAAVDLPALPPVAVQALGDAAKVVDFGCSLAHRRGHVPGALWADRTALAAAIPRLTDAEHIVVTSGSGTLAKLAAADLAGLGVVGVTLLAGGTAAWRAAGLPLEAGLRAPLSPANDVFERPYDLESDIEAAMNGYLTWEVGLVEQLERDATLVFPEFGGPEFD